MLIRPRMNEPHCHVFSVAVLCLSSLNVSDCPLNTVAARNSLSHVVRRRWRGPSEGRGAGRGREAMGAGRKSPSLPTCPPLRSRSPSPSPCVLVGWAHHTCMGEAGGRAGQTAAAAHFLVCGARIHLGGSDEGKKEGRKRSIGSGTPLAATAAAQGRTEDTVSTGET